MARRIYRSRVGGIGPYELAAEIDASSDTYFDDGFTLGGDLDPSALGVIRARPHARLAVDPGTILKMEGARIETRFGGQLIAEGLAGQSVVFTSRMDDTFGAGGTFDTNDDDDRGANENQPQPGDWGGLYFGPLGILSMDHALVAYGGGQNKIEGTTASFNVIELQQADARITNSIIEHNANGIGGQGPLDRFGRGFNMPATIFVRGTQPVIVNNIIRDNVNPDPSSFNPANGAGARDNAAITINLNSLTHEEVTDLGRSRGFIDVIQSYRDNRGPLIRGNRLENNGLNGMVIRGDELTAQSIWDDADIAPYPVTRQWLRDGTQPIWGATEPVYETQPADAGWDLYASASLTVQPGRTARVHTGLRLGLPPGVWALILPRSSVAAQDALVHVGVVDYGYTGELYIIVSNLTQEPLRIGIGIHAGLAIVGVLGPPQEPIYSAIGDMVNTAARLENMTKAFGCGMVVSDVVLREAGIDPGGATPHQVRVRGKTERLSVYAVRDPRTLNQGQTTV